MQLPQALKISESKVENAQTKTFVLDGRLAADPGQFVMAWLPGFEDKPFSLANADPISLTVAAVGPFSQAIHQLCVGDWLWIRGPLGRGYTLPAGLLPGQPVWLIGGGYGVAPLLFLARQTLESGHPVTAIIGARRSSDLLLVANFAALGVPLWLTTEDGSMGLKGLVTDALARLLADTPTRPGAIYACGPIGMLAAVARRCQAEQIPAQLGWEAPIRCGLGLCGSCEVGPGWLACLDGPVFPFDPLEKPPA